MDASSQLQSRTRRRTRLVARVAMVRLLHGPSSHDVVPVPVGQHGNVGGGMPRRLQRGVKGFHMTGRVPRIHRQSQPVPPDIVEKGPVPACEVLPRKAVNPVCNPKQLSRVLLRLGRLLLLVEFLALHHRQLVAAVVELVVCVALDPVEVHRVDLAQLQKPLPKVRVQGGFFVRLYPALGLPLFGPALFQSVDDIFGIGVKLHNARLFQGLQRCDDPGELHAVVGGLRLPAGELPLKLPI